MPSRTISIEELPELLEFFGGVLLTSWQPLSYSLTITPKRRRVYYFVNSFGLMESAKTARYACERNNDSTIADPAVLWHCTCHMSTGDQMVKTILGVFGANLEPFS